MPRDIIVRSSCACLLPWSRVVDAVFDRLISTPETVRVLGLSVRSVERLAEQGFLTKIKVLGATRYRVSEVQAIVRNGTSRREAA